MRAQDTGPTRVVRVTSIGHLTLRGTSMVQAISQDEETLVLAATYLLVWSDGPLRRAP